MKHREEDTKCISAIRTGRRAAVLLALATGAAAAAAAPEANPFDAPVLDVRPRVFIRRGDFAGLTVAKLRAAAGTAEFTAVRGKWRRRPPGRAIEWLLDGDRADLQAAIAGLKRMKASSGSWSGRGLSLIKLAALFDWLYPELDPATRKAVAARIEQAADAAADHIKRGRAPYFYSRTPGALAGVTIAGIALKGVSPKADGYLALFRQWGVKDYFKAYAWVDGAATGASYTMYYTYVDLPAVCAAWWSATGRNPAAWIRANQGGWLDGIVRFCLWSMRPGFAFTDINDLYRGIWDSHDQFCQGLDMASCVTRSGHGRAWAIRWLGRFGPALYHTEYAHNFIFRDPTLEPADLTALPRAALFGRDSCGYGFFRSAWPAPGAPDTATHVFFRAGDPMNVHGGVAAGEFQVFRHAPLAARSGKYGSYDSKPDRYHRNCISTNVVLMTDPADPNDRGDQNTRRGLKTDHRTWDQWLAIREKCGHDVATITAWKAEPGASRCRADLTAANPPSTCRRWIRELVWLADRHLVVLDIVETAKPGIRRRWQLHCPTKPAVGDRMVTVTNEAPDKPWAEPKLKPETRRARLFCRTLAPREYTVLLHADNTARAFNAAGRPEDEAAGNPYHLKHGTNVVQIDPGTETDRTVFLHVLTAVDAAGARPPAASVRLLEAGRVELTVGDAQTVLAVPAWWKPDEP